MKVPTRLDSAQQNMICRLRARSVRRAMKYWGVTTINASDRGCRPSQQNLVQTPNHETRPTNDMSILECENHTTISLQMLFNKINCGTSQARPCGGLTPYFFSASLAIQGRKSSSHPETGVLADASDIIASNHKHDLAQKKGERWSTFIIAEWVSVGERRQRDRHHPQHSE